MDPRQEINTTYIAIMGEPGVGKTSLFHAIVEGKDKAKTARLLGPEAANVDYQFSLNYGSPVMLKTRVWDSPKKEVFASKSQLAAKAYMRVPAIILMYDVTRRETFDSLEGLITRIRAANDGRYTQHITIVGNKCDCDPAARAVSVDEANTFAIKHMRDGMRTHFMETSAIDHSKVSEPEVHQQNAITAFVWSAYGARLDNKELSKPPTRWWSPEDGWDTPKQNRTCNFL